MNKNTENSRTSRGTTILEVMIATIVLTLISTILFQFLVSGEKIHGRGRLIARATMLAANEAERVKMAGGGAEKLEDSTYEIAADNRMFTVRRLVLPDVNAKQKKVLKDWKKNQIVEIRVRLSDDKRILVRCRQVIGLAP
jgi:hypothetical protein